MNERQRIEQDLRQSEERYRLAQEATGIGVWDWDVLNDHLYWDDRMWAMIGYPPDNRCMSYTDWHSMLHPDDIAGAEEEVQKQLHLGQGFIIEFRLRTRDGGWRWVQGRGKVVTRTDDGAPGRMMGTHTDIHERKQTELKLQQNEQRFKSYIEHAPYGIFLADATGNYTLVNRKASEITGYTVEELLNMSAIGLVFEEDRQQAFEHFKKVQQEGYAEAEMRFINKKGETRHKRVVATKLSDDEFLGFNEDITERKLAEEELARSNDELEQFAYVVSHDLRQPLRMVSSYMQLLEKQLDKHLDSETRQMMHFAADGAKRMNQMLVSLLEYSRVGKKNEAAEKLSSRVILDEVLLFLRPAIDEAEARIDISGDWPQIDVPRDEFTRLLQNLIDNAIKYRAAGQVPKITVEATVSDREYQFCIEDNGIGIDPEQQTRLFKVFQRLHTHEQYQGTGIGLAICRKIVERSGGRIWIESPGAGSGSRFCLTLPVPTAAGVQA